MLKKSSFQSMASLQNRTLSQLQHTLNAQLQLTHCIKSALPKPLAEHVLHSVLKVNTLTVYAHSANWASQLRFYSHVIIDAMANATGVANLILQIKIIAKPSATNANVRKAVIPSTEKIRCLKQCSDVVKDDQLKQALLKLSNTLTRLNSDNTK